MATMDPGRRCPGAWTVRTSRRRDLDLAPFLAGVACGRELPARTRARHWRACEREVVYSITNRRGSHIARRDDRFLQGRSDGRRSFWRRSAVRCGQVTRRQDGRRDRDRASGAFSTCPAPGQRRQGSLSIHRCDHGPDGDRAGELAWYHPTNSACQKTLLVVGNQNSNTIAWFPDR